MGKSQDRNFLNYKGRMTNKGLYMVNWEVIREAMKSLPLDTKLREVNF